MDKSLVINRFSKMSKDQKINCILQQMDMFTSEKKDFIKSFWYNDLDIQKNFDEFSENTLSNYFFPYSICPNFVINGSLYTVPMVIEESSVVAAASKAAKFWSLKGGFQAEVINTKKVGQIHLFWKEEPKLFESFFNSYRSELLEKVLPFLMSMEERGGGLSSIQLLNKTKEEDGYFQIFCEFETCDAMGANFINTVLEALSRELINLMQEKFPHIAKNLEILMSILSNYTPNCLVRAWIECSISDFKDLKMELSPFDFARRMEQAARVAKIDKYRATTHNKGILNGVDAVILATGNDFRAVEACAHAYASRDGQYRGLSNCVVKDKRFCMELEIPLALGTVGGLTELHPLAKFSLDLLNRPSAPELMMIASCLGLAQNFSALSSLVTTGIQKGHMKMHLFNILNHLKASHNEKEMAKTYFEYKVISFKLVRDYLDRLRRIQ